MVKQSSRGRQKVEMKKMQRQKHVTFSKHRLGAFNQANQKYILTDAQVERIVSSPTNRAFAFGSPNLKPITDMDHQSLLPHPAQTNAERLNIELSLLRNKMKAEKIRQKWLDQIIEERKTKYWWEAPIEELDLNQLEELLRAMQGLYDNVTKEIQTVSPGYLNGHAPLDVEASTINGFVHNGGCVSNEMTSFYARAPGTMNFCQNASHVPSTFNGFSLQPMVECSSNTMPQFDSRGSGMTGSMHNAGSLTTGWTSQMISGGPISLNNPMVPFNQIGPNFNE